MTFSEITGSGKLGTTRRERYSIAPDTLLKVQKQARDRDLDIIGVYHSHPDHPAVPSEFDRAIAWEEIKLSKTVANPARLQNRT